MSSELRERQRADAVSLADLRGLDRRGWWNWVLITGTAILTTLGLASALVPLINGLDTGPWPWTRTHLALLGGLSVVVISLALYLTQKQRELHRLRRHVLDLQTHSLDRARRQGDRLLALLKVSQTMAIENDPQATFDAITAGCQEIFECSQVSLMLLEAETKELVVRSAAGHVHLESVLRARVKLGDGIAGWVAERGGSLVLGSEVVDPGKYLDVVRQPVPLAASMVVPISVRGQLVGVLNIATRDPDVRYAEDDLRALEVFAENAGTAIRHAEQAFWMRRTIENLQPAR